MELIDALKMIQNECKKHESCTMCPLRDNDSPSLTNWCYLHNQNPGNWKFNEEIPPRIFE